MKGIQTCQTRPPLPIQKPIYMYQIAPFNVKGNQLSPGLVTKQTPIIIKEKKNFLTYLLYYIICNTKVFKIFSIFSILVHKL